MQSREEMQQAVKAALAKSQPVVRRKFGALDVDELVSVREQLRLLEARQTLGLQRSFNLLSVRRLLAKHDSICQQLQDNERATGGF